MQFICQSALAVIFGITAMAGSVRLNNYNDWSSPDPSDADYAQKMSNLTKRDEIIFYEEKIASTGLTPMQLKATYKPTLKVYGYYTLLSKSNWETDWVNGDDPSVSVQLNPIPYQTIVDNDWWLRDGNGVIAKESTGVYYVDIGKAGVKESWLTNLFARLSGKGYDGVILDYWEYSLISEHVNPSPVDYADDGAWYANALQPFMDYIILGLQEAGYTVIGNDAGQSDTTDARKLHARSLLDGTVYEQGVVNWWDSGGGWLSGTVISNRIAAVFADPLVTWVADGGLRDVIGGSPNPDLEQKRMASLAYYYVSIPADQSKHSYHHAYDWTSYWYAPWDFDIGTPSDERIQLEGQYAWSRKFTHGIVLLNYGATAESAEALDFVLDRPYWDINNTKYHTRVTLPAHTGLILRDRPNGRIKVGQLKIGRIIGKRTWF